MQRMVYLLVRKGLCSCPHPDDERGVAGSTAVDLLFTPAGVEVTHSWHWGPRVSGSGAVFFSPAVDPAATDSSSGQEDMEMTTEMTTLSPEMVATAGRGERLWGL